MDKALVFGTKDCRFESCQGHSGRTADKETVLITAGPKVNNNCPSPGLLFGFWGVS